MAITYYSYTPQISNLFTHFSVAPYRVPGVESFIHEVYSQRERADFEFINNLEGAYVVNDLVDAVYEDCRINKAKAYSQGQIDRLAGKAGALRFVSLLGDEETSLYGDDSPFVRHFFYKLRFQKRKGFTINDVLKCTRVKTDKELFYVTNLDTQFGPIYIAITGKYFDQVATQLNLPVDRSEMIYEVLWEISQGILIKDFGIQENGKVLLYSNKGISTGSGMAFKIDEKWINWESAKANPLEEIPSVDARCGVLEDNDEDYFSRFILLETFITNEAAAPELIHHAESAVHIETQKHQLTNAISLDTYKVLEKRRGKYLPRVTFYDSKGHTH